MIRQMRKNKPQMLGVALAVFLSVLLCFFLPRCEQEPDPTYELAILSFEAGYHTGISDGYKNKYEYKDRVKAFCEQLGLDSVYYKSWEMQGKK